MVYLVGVYPKTKNLQLCWRLLDWFMSYRMCNVKKCLRNSNVLEILLSTWHTSTTSSTRTQEHFAATWSKISQQSPKSLTEEGWIEVKLFMHSARQCIYALILCIDIWKYIESVIELHILPATQMVQKLEALKPNNHFSKQDKENLLIIHWRCLSTEIIYAAKLSYSTKVSFCVIPA